MKNYKINEDTLAIVPISKDKTKVYEKENVIIVSEGSMKLIEDNCAYYGNSYEGRKIRTQQMIGITHKPPIVIEESHSIVFFPTSSPRLKDCCWISLNNIDNSKSCGNFSIIEFNNESKLRVNVSSHIINSQVLKAARLESVSRRRNKESEKMQKN